MLFARLVHLHQCGVIHNDIEPRNVTLSETSGSLIIDFDEASFDHVCTGASCKELCQVAQVLRLDAAAELAALDQVSRPRPTYFKLAAAIFAVWSVYYLLYL
ncbi:hypothetical protein K438DRAFT_1987960 [Mycena galopus ATCC 62051]|nr:hypothetical protein K438DRAFT_1987960 [Mycena galopus ATCC 62051]